jgi:hypothetical protein
MGRASRSKASPPSMLMPKHFKLNDVFMASPSIQDHTSPFGLEIQAFPADYRVVQIVRRV